MIWYLLYPLRGTTEPPVLPPSHPLHSGFARYGRYAASRIVTTLLVSAVAATVLLYPIPFLFTSDYINGASNLPHHVWTVAQPISGVATAQPDIVMRSIWLHASYMDALNADMLSSALDLQDELLGVTEDFRPARAHGVDATAVDSDDGADLLAPNERDAFHVVNGLTNQSWFFHSPLLYWGCSRERILADPDILATINDRKNQSTSANVTLRHSIVFAGKRFEDRRLRAADALVITLLHLGDSPVGRQWVRRVQALAEEISDKWDIYPPDGRAPSSQLYEFQFKPISFHDIASLALAYTMTLLYCLVSLSKLRAVKSKLGLMITILIQIIFSTMSSFTVCAIFNLDLSRIPRAAYPLVILSMSLENVVRLINAVILTPFEDSVSSRIGQAFGETAHTALASSIQNIFLLACLSRLTSPGVSEFCVFAAVAIIFDFFYLSTFFLSVLSLDVRRMELGDALAKASQRRSRGPGELRGHVPWWDRLRQGKAATSTRVAGTIVMLGFVIIAQWHFFVGEGLLGKLLRLFRGSDQSRLHSQMNGSPLRDLHQARSPTSWLRIQDHDTAREVINTIKPTSYSYIARVFDPIVFVRKQSDRMPHLKEPRLLPALYDFVNHELARFIVVVIIVVAALRLLTNLLLWEDVEDGYDEGHDADELPLLSVRSLARGHPMDVALLESSADGHLVSVGLDGTVRAWSVRGIGTSYVLAKGGEQATTVPPVILMAIDNRSQWLALLSRHKKTTLLTLSFWSLTDRRWGPSIRAGQELQRPLHIVLEIGAREREPRALIVHQDGVLSEVDEGSWTTSQPGDVFPRQLVCACSLERQVSEGQASIMVLLAVSKLGEYYLAWRGKVGWDTQRVDIEGRAEPGAHTIQALSSLAVFAVALEHHVSLVSAHDGRIVHSLPTDRILPGPFKCAYLRHRLSQAGSTGLGFLTLAYIEFETQQLVLQSFIPRDDCDAICLERPSENPGSDWCSWSSAKQIKKLVKNPGLWDLSLDGNAVGIRRVGTSRKESPNSISPGLRSRHGRRASPDNPFKRWLVWTASPGGRGEADEERRLIEDSEQAEHLLITKLGPKARVGLNCVAFGFGDMIKLVMVGGQARLASSPDESLHDVPALNCGSRRRRYGSGLRSKPLS